MLFQSFCFVEVCKDLKRRTAFLCLATALCSGSSTAIAVGTPPQDDESRSDKFESARKTVLNDRKRPRADHDNPTENLEDFAEGDAAVSSRITGRLNFSPHIESSTTSEPTSESPHSSPARLGREQRENGDPDVFPAAAPFRTFSDPYTSASPPQKRLTPRNLGLKTPPKLLNPSSDPTTLLDPSTRSRAQSLDSGDTAPEQPPAQQSSPNLPSSISFLSTRQQRQGNRLDISPAEIDHKMASFALPPSATLPTPQDGASRSMGVGGFCFSDVRAPYTPRERINKRKLDMSADAIQSLSPSNQSSNSSQPNPKPASAPSAIDPLAQAPDLVLPPVPSPVLTPVPVGAPEEEAVPPLYELMPILPAPEPISPAIPDASPTQRQIDPQINQIVTRSVTSNNRVHGELPEARRSGGPSQRLDDSLAPEPISPAIPDTSPRQRQIDQQISQVVTRAVTSNNRFHGGLAEAHQPHGGGPPRRNILPCSDTLPDIEPGL